MKTKNDMLMIDGLLFLRRFKLQKSLVINLFFTLNMVREITKNMHRRMFFVVFLLLLRLLVLLYV